MLCWWNRHLWYVWVGRGTGAGGRQSIKWSFLSFKISMILETHFDWSCFFAERQTIWFIWRCLNYIVTALNSMFTSETKNSASSISFSTARQFFYKLISFHFFYIVPWLSLSLPLSIYLPLSPYPSLSLSPSLSIYLPLSLNKKLFFCLCRSILIWFLWSLPILKSLFRSHSLAFAI